MSFFKFGSLSTALATSVLSVLFLTASPATAQLPPWCDTGSHSLNTADQNGLDFTIMPMGGSIVYGLMSSDGNGFRLPLQNLLEDNGTAATMVGTQESGNMTDNHHEAYEAITIGGLNNKSYHSGAYEMKANVVLLHVGTNDCWYVKGENGTGANRQFGFLLDSIREKLPDALVLASTLIRNTNEWANNCILGVNAGLPDTVAAAKAKGQEVRLVDMYPYVPADQIVEDGTHPTDEGYRIMAQHFYDGLVNATREVCVVEQQQRASTDSNDQSSATASATSSASSVTPSSSASSAVKASGPITLLLLLAVCLWT